MASAAESQQVYADKGFSKIEQTVLSKSLDQTVVRQGEQRVLSLDTQLLIFLLVLAALWLAKRIRYWIGENRTSAKIYPPVLPGGLPVIGNLLQLNSLKPHRTITDMSEKLGPIFRLNLGPLKYIVLTSPELAKEAGVTKYESASSRYLLSNLKVWSQDKKIVALMDYGDEYRKLKKLLLSKALAAAPQKSLGGIREQLLKNVVEEIGESLQGSSGLINVREQIKHYLFPFVMNQIMGYVPQSIYVETMGTLGLWDIFEKLVTNPMKSVIFVDWRDFLPFLKWLPNRHFQKKVVEVAEVRCMVVRALIEQKRRLLQTQGPTGGFLEHLLSGETDLTHNNVDILTWEPIIEGSDTSLVTTEWAMYELAKNQDIQDQLYEEIQTVVGNRPVTENDLPNLPLLDRIFKETLRLHSPIVLLPPRRVAEDITIGGYHISKGQELLINIYGISCDKTRWAKWDEWIPDRFLNEPELDMGINNFQLIPFGMGKRRCPGALQANTILGSFVASFVQNFQCSLPAISDIAVQEDTGYLTTQKLHPLEVIARPRK